MISTQAYDARTPGRSPKPQTDGATVAYTLDAEDDDTKSTKKVRRQSRSPSPKPDQTVPYDMEVESVQGKGKTSPKQPKGKKSPAIVLEGQTVAYTMDVNDDDEVKKSMQNTKRTF